jgi:hypothetical protein
MSLAWSDSKAPLPRLSQIAALNVRCDDCGRTSRLERQALDGLPDYCLSELRKKLLCSHCREMGALGKNVAAMPILRRAYG